jgi:Domain of unknown function (DUF4267)
LSQTSIRSRRIDRRGHHLHRRTISPCASTAAAGFGIAAWHDGGKADPYLSVKGVRDIASGLIAVILLAVRMPHVLGWFELAASTIPIGDAIIVLRGSARRPPPTACTARRPWWCWPPPRSYSPD